MAEEKIVFHSGTLKLEGLLGMSSGQSGVVVTHPHPMYGGDMYNNVVESVIKAYSEKRYATLRFNFRGAGGSEGDYDDGIGEQEDLKAALQYLHGLGKRSIDLVGYSFGAWINALGMESLDQVKRMIMISPPVAFMDFSFLRCHPRIQLVIAGSADDIAQPEMIRAMLQTWNPDARFEIIQGADHFYWGRDGELKSIIQEFLD
ncbi:MAG: alpha/beta fold hydrolase [Desulfatiglans sp.]|jgi:alpha/beta superfamily hydrolase|nr:alpha/beta fold hydrolase [Thermodesulfobacteriota bacterium]MEE4353782.1 alpha/beta fold hydrolase [Desulfatiglans sp.]